MLLKMTRHFSTSSFNVFPNDLNMGNTLFGGKILAEIDCEASKVARSIVYGNPNIDNIVTANLNANFIRPAVQSDLIILEADVIKFGKTSMTIEVHAYIKNGSNRDDWHLICVATTVFVATNSGVPTPHNATF